MKTQKPASKSWTKPGFVRLGTIRDVAKSNDGPNQCGSATGGCIPKS
jgi:hypothetical protein